MPSFLLTAHQFNPKLMKPVVRPPGSQLCPRDAPLSRPATTEVSVEKVEGHMSYFSHWEIQP